MPGLSSIRRVAQVMGDTSSLQGGGGGLAGRAGRRMFGAQLGGFQGGLSVFGLIMYAEFLVYLKNLIDDKASKDVYLASTATYAAAWELGHYNEFLASIGGNPWVSPKPYFFRAPLEVQNPSSAFTAFEMPRIPKASRSGLYEGQRYVGDIRAFASGDIIGRGARRAAGRASASFFWGTLMKPGNNPVWHFMLMVQKQVRRNIREVGLVDTGALKESFQLGLSLEEALAKSRTAMLERLDKVGRSSMASRKISQDAKTGGPDSIGARIDDASRVARIIPRYTPS